jgi:hypothetical protein
VVSVQWTGERLRVEVTDADPTLVRPSHAEAMDEHGRGLFLVAALATEWGSHPCTAGKKTWFELAIPTPSEGTAAVTVSHADAAKEEPMPITCTPVRIEHQAA